MIPNHYPTNAPEYMPEYVQQQIDQKERDRQNAIGLALQTLEDARAEFKITIDTINRCYDGFVTSPVTTQRTPRSKKNLITADPTVAQYL